MNRGTTCNLCGNKVLTEAFVSQTYREMSTRFTCDTCGRVIRVYRNFATEKTITKIIRKGNLPRKKHNPWETRVGMVMEGGE